MNNNNNNKDEKKSPSFFKGPGFIILIVSLVLTFGLNFLMTSMSEKNREQISYNEFLAMVKDGKVDEVVFENDKILIYQKAPQSTETNEQTDKFLEMFGIADKDTLEQMKNSTREQFLTGYIRDERLLQLLDDNNIKYSTPIIYSNPILNFFVSWILPLLIMGIIFSLLSRSLT
ncbi:MAG: ATP-dependent metallopeptidase FtsH/Yme1/Tma family protein, partial [Clostridia bacterium]|nr:ATP-dependent metallopeptidase FtsH/Yme1/Tma family protein [Clostridia bacterium]